MDPDETLELIRTRYDKILFTDPYNPLCEVIRDLDNWLSAGGALPSDWKRTK